MMRSAHPTCAALMLGAMLTLNAPSLAQAPAQTPPASGSEAAEAAVRRIFEDGVTAGKQERWEDARQAFLKAWQLKRYPQIAANLGRAEVKVGRYRDGAKHLAFFLRESRDASNEDRAIAQELIAEARAKLGTISLRVEPAGAEVLVDGVSLGAAPFADEVYVDPGRHVLEARREGYQPMRRELDMVAGTTGAVQLQLTPIKRPAEAAAPAPTAPEEGGRSGVVIGVGIGASVAAAGAGAVLLVMAMDKASQKEPIAKDGYPDRSREEWLGLEQDRANLLNAATWSFIGAGVLGAATVVYALTGSKPARPQRTGQVWVHPAGAGIGVRGVW